MALLALCEPSLPRPAGFFDQPVVGDLVEADDAPELLGGRPVLSAELERHVLKHA